MSAVIWIGFLIFVVALVLLDLGVFHRKSHEIKVPEALAWTAAWVALALVFNAFVYFLYDNNWLGWANASVHQLNGQQAAIQFFTGYLLEKSLSVDNLFVIAMIFSYFRVPLSEQHRVLFWGILGALVLRGIMIFAGVALIERFDWLVYVFGLLLLASATKMLLVRHDNICPDKNIAVRLARKLYPFSPDFDGSRFFTIKNGQRMATPLFLTLVLVETSDVVFAIDSIPAILAVTRDPFLVFTSNVFAILGLRSLYFALAGMMDRFRYMKMSLVFLLAYIGVKMLLSHHYPIPNLVSLAIIGGLLSVGVAASIVGGARDTAALVSPIVDELDRLAVLTYKQAKRVVILIVGSTILIVGVIMIFLPGPAILVIPLGLTLLAAEYAWARLWLRKFRKMADDIQNKAENQVNKWRGKQEVK
jgi:tellurite resistance protein TerC